MAKQFKSKTDVLIYLENKLKTTWPNNVKSACNKKNYFVHDICSRKPFPFDDKFFDFTTCTQTLEDIRDPIWVLEEISRISKAGYIDTPSIRYERSSVASKYFAGAPHHRWFVNLDEDNKVRFFLKYAFVHAPFLRLPLAKNFSEKTMNFIWNYLDTCFLAPSEAGETGVYDYLPSEDDEPIETIEPFRQVEPIEEEEDGNDDDDDDEDSENEDETEND